MVTHQVSLDEADRSLLVKSACALSRGLFSGLDLRKVLLHTGEFREDWVFLCVYALEAKRVLCSVSDVISCGRRVWEKSY